MSDSVGGQTTEPAPPDAYQKRYIDHQHRKSATLAQIMEERHSERMYLPKPVEPGTLSELCGIVESVPSSCARRAVSVRVESQRDRLALLGGLLVGGVGWIHRAPAVLLIFADPIAYKAGDEINWMPYLDGGVVIEALYLKATALGLSGCYVNPNIRPFNRAHFSNVFGDGVFLGAFACGWPRPQ